MEGSQLNFSSPNNSVKCKQVSIRSTGLIQLTIKILQYPDELLGIGDESTLESSLNLNFLDLLSSFGGSLLPFLLKVNFFFLLESIFSSNFVLRLEEFGDELLGIGSRSTTSERTSGDFF